MIWNNVNKFYDNKYIMFIDLKNAYDKVVHDKLFIKLSNYGINKEIINAIKIIYSNAKIKISSNDDYIMMVFFKEVYYLQFYLISILMI